MSEVRVAHWAPMATRLAPDLPPAQSWQPWSRDGVPNPVTQPALFALPTTGQAPPLHPDRIRTVRLVPEQAPGLPDVATLAVRLGVGMAEVLDGRRSAAHLTHYVAAPVLERLEALAVSAPQGRRGRVRLHSLRVQLTTAHCAEACLHVTAQRRLVLAYRLVGRGTRWVCTELQPLTPGSPHPVAVPTGSRAERAARLVEGEQGVGDAL